MIEGHCCGNVVEAHCYGNVVEAHCCGNVVEAHCYGNVVEAHCCGNVVEAHCYGNVVEAHCCAIHMNVTDTEHSRTNNEHKYDFLTAGFLISYKNCYNKDIVTEKDLCGWNAILLFNVAT